LRIWICNHYAIPPDRPGGTRHHSLAKALIEQGHEVAVIAASHGLPMTQAGEGKPSVDREFDGVPFVWLATPPYYGNSVGRLKNMLAFGRALRRLAPERVGFQPDVVIGSSPHLIAANAASQLARRFKAVFVAEIRDIWPQSLVDLGVSPKHPFVIYQGGLEKKVYRCAKGLVTLLPGSVPYFVGMGVPKSRILVVPNGIDLSLAPPVQPEPSGFTAIYTGAHGPANNLDVVLDAAKLCKEKVQFRLVGSGPEKARLIERRDSEGIANVEFGEPVSKTEVFGLLARANVCIHCLSDAKVFSHGVSPNKMFDYMSAGRPVVVSASVKDSPVELAGCGTIVPAGDAVALASAIDEIATLDSEERSLMGLRGRQYVEEHHDLAKLAANLADFLQRIKSS